MKRNKKRFLSAEYSLVRSVVSWTGISELSPLSKIYPGSLQTVWARKKKKKKTTSVSKLQSNA